MYVFLTMRIRIYQLYLMMCVLFMWLENVTQFENEPPALILGPLFCESDSVPGAALAQQ